MTIFELPSIVNASRYSCNKFIIHCVEFININWDILIEIFHFSQINSYPPCCRRAFLRRRLLIRLFLLHKWVLDILIRNLHFAKFLLWLQLLGFFPFHHSCPFLKLHLPYYPKCHTEVFELPQLQLWRDHDSDLKVIKKS